METLAEQFGSTSFWVSSVVLAGLVNVASSYARPALDKTVARWFHQYRDKLAEQQKDRQELAHAVSTSNDHYMRWALCELRFSFRSLTWGLVLTGCFCGLILLSQTKGVLDRSYVRVIFFGMGVTSISAVVGCLRNLFDAHKISRLLYDADHADSTDEATPNPQA